jgi:hypothetical protein
MILGKYDYLCISCTTRDTFAYNNYCSKMLCENCIIKKLYLSGIETGLVKLKSGAVIILLDELEFNKNTGDAVCF